MKMQRHHPATGFSLVAVLFLLVVLAGLGTVIAQLSTTQHLGALNALQGQQAHYAARAAGDWARYRLLVAGEGCASLLGSNLQVEGLTASISACTQAAADEAGPSTMFGLQVDVIGNAGRMDEVSRSLRMELFR
ncbi:MAG: hypothetical protein AB1344_09000 [Pseudomonadota bacterium]